MKLLTAALCAAFALALPAPTLAQHDHRGASSGPGAVSGMAQGEVRNVDKSAKTVTLKHGPLPGVGMPSMMSRRVPK
jgi:Cu/Ag efflux protein CusF